MNSTLSISYEMKRIIICNQKPFISQIPYIVTSVFYKWQKLIRKCCLKWTNWDVFNHRKRFWNFFSQTFKLNISFVNFVGIQNRLRLGLYKFRTGHKRRDTYTQLYNSLPILQRDGKHGRTRYLDAQSVNTTGTTQRLCAHLR